MKRLLPILLVLLLSGCTKPAEDRLLCRVTLALDREVVALTVDNSLSGNYFRNLNTGEEYDFPTFVNGKCELRVLKGVYVIAFDGTAAFADGTGVHVRSAEHSSTTTAVTLTADEETVLLNLLEL